MDFDSHRPWPDEGNRGSTRFEVGREEIERLELRGLAVVAVRGGVEAHYPIYGVDRYVRAES